MAQPDWKVYREARLASEGEVQPARPCVCPLCGFRATDDVSLKQHKKNCKCAARRKAKAKAQAKTSTPPPPRPQSPAQRKRKLEESRADAPLLQAIPNSRQKRRLTKLAFPATKEPPPLRPRHAGHAADAARLPQVYFERQERALCGLHALNNALGAKHFSSKDMVGAAELFLVENAELSDVLADHVDQENGWYSIETMCTALRAKSMQLFGKATWELSLEPVVSASQLVKATGAVQNRENHWVAYKATTRGELLLLDSLQPAVQLIAEEEFLTQLASYPGTYLIVSV